MKVDLGHGRPRWTLVVKATAGSHKLVDTVNGRKVNGVGVTPLVPKGTESMNQTAGNGGGGGGSAAWLTGGFVENRSVYRQNFLIRSYEIGPDRTATMETLMNLLQVPS